MQSAQRSTTARHDVTLREVSLSDKYTATSGRVFISGIEALVRLTLDQRRLDRSRGLNTAAFVCGYEGSPLGGLDLELQRNSSLLSEANVVFRPGVNEELAATAVAGSQLLAELPGRRHDGVAGFWYGKNPGLDRAADAIRHGTLSGTAPLGGAVAIVGDDPTCKSSTIPSSCEQTTRSLLVPLLTPSSVAEVLTFGLHAIAMSRYAGIWVAMKMVADIADSSATVELEDPASFIPAPDPRREIHEPVLVGPQSLDAEHRLHTFRLPRVGEYAHHTGLNAVHFEPRRPRVAIVAPGLPFATVLRALSDLGLSEPDLDELGVRLVRIGMAWPNDSLPLRELVAGVEEVLVIEDKVSFVESQLKEALYRQPHQPVIVGHNDEVGRPLTPASGAVTAEMVAGVLGRRLALPERSQHWLERIAARERLTLHVAADDESEDPPERAPFFCSGCPHNISTRADDDQLVGLGIGCHIMVALHEKGRGHQVGMTQMGGEGAQWIGLAPFTDDEHYFQNLGDGTFFHSGSLAVRAAVAADVNLTYKLLFNHAVAMTGGQNPVGSMTVASVVDLLAAEGVRRVVVTTADPAAYHKVRLNPIATVRHRDDLAEIQRELGSSAGVSVLLHDDWCAAEERRLRRRGTLPTPVRRIWINERVCEGCGDCVSKATCVSLVPVATAYGRKTAVDQHTCNLDYSCARGDCPSFIEVLGAPKSTEVADPPIEPREPVRRVPDTVLVRMPGIGGTGVVTVSRILQMAAHLAGRFAAGVDQTGLAQKGGPVLSDVRISAEPLDGAVRASACSADVLLGFDLFGAASASNLSICDRTRTVPVVNTAQTSTVPLAQDPFSRFPRSTSLVARIARHGRPDEGLFLDTDWIANRLHLESNMVLLGAAYQHGCLPVPAEAIESAITLNGVASDDNLRAFRWGRAAAADPDVVHRALAPAVPSAAAPDTLQELLDARTTELVSYQDERYAREYRSAVQAVAQRERELLGSADEGRVAYAFAAGLFKLMAYKDEYEVARLHLDATERERLIDQFGNDTPVRVMLHPPVLRALGLRRKIALGRSAQSTFRALVAMRRLRGTMLDPFGHTAVRRLERRLPGEYRGAVDAALEHLDTGTVDLVVQIAELPDLIRGYESIKEANVERFRTRLDELTTELTRVNASPPVPRV
jgi:indolepyruvate ferredoxin oxidoreductase